jgi:hypothetical protein
MSDEFSNEDHAYFSSLEEVFIRLRGAPLLLSPADWAVARDWRRQGVPLDVVCKVLESIFGEKPELRGRSGIRSLRYFKEPVDRAWREIRSLGSDWQREPEPLDLLGRLRALAEAIPEELPRSKEIRARVLAARGTPEEVEASLASLDREILARAQRDLPEEERLTIAREAESTLRRVRSRLAPEQTAETRRRLERRHLRRRLGLPVLSLFGPAARGDEGRSSE